ncbi:MAG: cupin domain-containing protein [Candidatus Brocadiaceae bacterium]|nr:cupin domain-containing protein [Candidatus Brocadiaceae bacterium]
MAIIRGEISTYRTTQDDMVAKITIIKTDSLSLEAYYFKAGQALGYHRHPTGDQIFTIIEGSGTFKLDDGNVESIEVREGSVFLAPANVWHDLIDSGKGKLVAQQVTQQPSGMEKR